MDSVDSVDSGDTEDDSGVNTAIVRAPRLGDGPNPDDPIVRARKPSRNLNWKAVRKVSPVRNQGRCGSCWAFSAVAQI